MIVFYSRQIAASLVVNFRINLIVGILSMPVRLAGSTRRSLRNQQCDTDDVQSPRVLNNRRFAAEIVVCFWVPVNLDILSFCGEPWLQRRSLQDLASKRHYPSSLSFSYRRIASITHVYFSYHHAD